MKTYTARAVHWDGGWELHIADVGVTQVRLFKDALGQVGDYLDTMGLEWDEVHVQADIGGLAEEIVDAKRLTAEAEELQLTAAMKWRRSARKLRDLGLSVTDVASLMEISRGRVSQLLADA